MEIAARQLRGCLHSFAPAEDALQKTTPAMRAWRDLLGPGNWQRLGRSWKTKSDLRIQLSKLPGTGGRYEHEWGALRAAAQAVSLKPAWARAWLALADAAMTRNLYRVAEAAAERAYKIEDNEAARASYVRALVNVGRYEDALQELGNPGDAWRQCFRGFIAPEAGQGGRGNPVLRRGETDPRWIWAWHSSICALVSIGDLAPRGGSQKN